MASRSPPSPNAGSVVDALWVTRAVDGLLSGDRHRLLLTVHRFYTADATLSHWLLPLRFSGREQIYSAYRALTSLVQVQPRVKEVLVQGETAVAIVERHVGLRPLALVPSSFKEAAAAVVGAAVVPTVAVLQLASSADGSVKIKDQADHVSPYGLAMALQGPLGWVTTWLHAAITQPLLLWGTARMAHGLDFAADFGAWYEAQFRQPQPELAGPGQAGPGGTGSSRDTEQSGHMPLTAAAGGGSS